MTDKPRQFRARAGRWVLACCSVLAPTLAVQAADAPQLLRLRSRTIDTATAPNLLAALRSGAPLDPAGIYILQLDGPITSARRAELVALGVRFGDYLPDDAYRVDLRNVAWSELGNTPYVHWLGRPEASWKIAPEIGQTLAPWQSAERRELAQTGRLKLTVTLERGADRAAAEADLTAAGAEIVRRYRDRDTALYDVVTVPERIATLAAIDAVRFIEEAPEAAPRNSSVRWIVQSNQLNMTPLYANGLHGEGQIVGIIDGFINEQHCSFYDPAPIGPQHRKILAYNAALGYDMHGTHVAGTAVGDAGVDDDTRGVAYAARLVFNTIDVPATQQELALHHAQGARIHNNSWGNDATNLYDSLSRAIDAFAYAFEDDLVVFAVTNQTTLRNPENAKNLLAVGATGDTPDQDEHCLGGIGPTLDGRRKPEIYAPGCGVYSSSGDGYSCAVASDSGTSMACPATSGVALLTRQYYTDGYYPTGAPVPLDGFTPTGALLKATLLNGAVDLTDVAGYPSDLEGWGRVLADASLAFPQDTRRLWIADVRNADGLNTGEVKEYPIVVHGSAEKLKVTCVWTDPPPAPEAAVAAVNNLDLEVVAPDATLYRGNVFAGGVSATGGTADTLNNVEQVHVAAPMAGTWTVRVGATVINQARQGFALVVTGDVTGPESAVRIELLDPLPPLLAPATPQTLHVRVADGAEQVAPGSARLHVRLNAAGPYAVVPLVAEGNEVFAANLPAALCAEQLAFYFSASGQAGGTAKLPATAPTAVFSVPVGDVLTTFADDFESDLGWTVGGAAADGYWERGIPANGNRGDPPFDADGSGRCYLTDNLAGNSDVDDGMTTLTSPMLDVSAGGEITYAYWLGDIASGALGTEDYLSVEIATDSAGTNWQEVRRYTSALATWRTDAIAIPAEAPASATLRVRFTAADLPPGDVVEAGIDAFRVERTVCNAGGNGDFDGDGDVDLADAAAFQACGARAALRADCNAGDINGDGVADLADFAAFVSRLWGPGAAAADADLHTRFEDDRNLGENAGDRPNDGRPAEANTLNP